MDKMALSEDCDVVLLKSELRNYFWGISMGCRRPYLYLSPAAQLRQPNYGVWVRSIATSFLVLILGIRFNQTRSLLVEVAGHLKDIGQSHHRAVLKLEAIRICRGREKG